jgi:topoisomerase-4 subunit B
MDNIRTMEMLEHIRHRPGMYLLGPVGDGNSQSDGLYTILTNIIKFSIYELEAGYDVAVSLDVQDNIVKLRSFGKTIPFNALCKSCEVLTYFGLRIANALSENFTIVSHRAGEYMSATFSKGVLMSEDRGLTSENDGVYFEFMPDREILNDYVFRMDILTDIVKEICCLHKGVKINLNGVEYISHNGLLDMFDQSLNQDYRYTPIHICTEQFEIVFTHIESSEEYVKSYVNEHRTKAGGTHEEAFRKGLAYALSKSLKEKITPEKCSRGLLAIIKINVEEPCYVDAGKHQLGSSHMWYDCFGNHGPTIYDTLRYGLLKAITGNYEVYERLLKICPR